MTEIIPINLDEDYDVIELWWLSHGWKEAVPKHHLPPFGFKCQIDGKDICAGWAYMDNGGTGVAMMEWLVSNPEARPREILKGLKTLVEFMTRTLKSFDYSFVLTACRDAGLARMLERCGFEVNGSDITHLTATI